MTVLRRLDLALESTKEKVLKTYNHFKGKLDNLSGLLTSDQHGSGLAFITSDAIVGKELHKHATANFELYKLFTENADFCEDFSALMFGVVKELINTTLYQRGG